MHDEISTPDAVQDVIRPKKSLSERDLEDISSYITNKFVFGDVRKSSLKTYGDVSAMVAKYLNKPLSKMTVEDAASVRDWIKNEIRSPNTLRAYRHICLDLSRHIHGYLSDVARVFEEWDIEEEAGETNWRVPAADVVDMIEYCYNKDWEEKSDKQAHRGAALLAVLYETGREVSEVLDLTVADIFPYVSMPAVRFDDEEGSRFIPLQWSYQYLRPHMMKLDSAAGDQTLWPPVKDNEDGEISSGRAREIISDIVEEVGIKRDVTPDILRQSRILELSKCLTIPQMRYYFGWSASSDSPLLYKTISGNRNINLEDNTEGTDAAVLICPRCQRKHMISRHWCECGWSFSPVIPDTDDYIFTILSGMLATDGNTERTNPEANVKMWPLDFDPENPDLDNAPMWYECLPITPCMERELDQYITPEVETVENKIPKQFIFALNDEFQSGDNSDLDEETD